MIFEYRRTMTENTNLSLNYVGLVRRLMAIVYDLFLLLALLFIATSAVMVFNQGNAIVPGHPLYAFYVSCLLIISFCFYGWFWTHGGQTLGMKTWKMKLQQTNGHPVTLPLAFIRFITAVISWSAAGLGFLWSLFNPQKRTCHDIASNFVLVDLRPGK